MTKPQPKASEPVNGKPSPPLAIAASALDALALFLSLAFVLVLFRGDLAYRLGKDDLPQKIAGGLFWVLVARAGCALPWRDCLRARSWARAGQMVLFLALGALALRPALAGGLALAASQCMQSRVACDGLSEEQLLDRLFRSGRDYPRNEFVRQARQTIGENGAAIYDGDLRAHVLAALLYPRKIYQLPEAQEFLLKMAEIPFVTRRDPGLPVHDATLPRGTGDEAAFRDLNKLQAGNKIQWTIVYNARDLRGCAVRRLP